MVHCVATYLSVAGPKLVPLHDNDGTGRTLTDDELFESFDRHTVTKDATNCGETRVLPGGGRGEGRRDGEREGREGRKEKEGRERGYHITNV